MPINAMIGFDAMSLAPELATRNSTAIFDSMGAVYDQGPIQIQGMLSRIKFSSITYENSHAGYVIASYRLPLFTPYLGYSQVRSAPQAISSPVAPAIKDVLNNQFIARTHSDQQTVMLGARWDFQQNMALKVQVDRILGAPKSYFSFRGQTNAAGSNPPWNGRMSIFSIALDFVF